MMSSFENMLKKVDYNPNNFQNNNIVIVPDKFTFNAERMIFNAIKKEAVFNVDVFSFNRLANKVVENKNIQILSKQKGIMVISKLILKNKDKISTFNKLSSSSGLAQTIYETIMQFKSSGILPNEIIIKNDNSHLDNKLKDIKFIYELYEKELSENFSDEANRLIQLSNQIKTSELISSSSIYIGMFENFTYIQLEVISNLIKYSKDITISLCANTIQPNSNIYLNENLQKIIDLCNSKGFKYEIENIYDNNKNEISHMKNNLFAVADCKKISSQNILIYEAENKQEEIEFIAKKIKELVLLKNYRFSDINIAVGNLSDYEETIKKVFNEYGLPYNIDTTDKLSNTYLAKFILNLCELKLKNNNIRAVINFIKSDFVQLDKQDKDNFETYCYKYGINNYKFLKPFILGKQETEFDKIENIREYYSSIYNVIDNGFVNENNSQLYTKTIFEIFKVLKVEEKINNLSNNKEFDINERKKFDLSFKKVVSVLNDIESVLGESSVSFEMFYELLKSTFDSTVVSSIPLKVDSIFIGDYLEGYFNKEKIMFLVNVTEKNFPVVQNDCGIITDKEIDLLSTKNILNPTIRQINKRAKFKAFELSVCFKEKLFLTYAVFNEGKEQKPSEIIDNIKKLFINNVFQNKGIYYRELTYEYSPKMADIVFAGNLKNVIKSNMIDVEGLKELGFEENEKLVEILRYEPIYQIKNQDMNKVSISKVENYNTCPFKYYSQYVLGIKENEIYGVKPLDVGNILHECAQMFVDRLIKNNYKLDENVKSLSTKIFNETLSQNKYEQVDKTSIVAQNLIEEVENLFEYIIYQTSKSNFKPTKTEFSFRDYDLCGVKVSGIIDRVDEFENYCIILDYKTGSDIFDYKDVFVGKKLQILIYSYILEKITNKRVFGSFYLPVTNKFSKEDDEEYDKYKFSGIYFNNLELMKCLDNDLESLNKSDIFKATITSKNEPDRYTLNVALTNEELDNIKSYAVKMLMKTISNINSGNITPSPLGDKCCEYCPYFSLCKYDINQNGYRNKPKGINKNTFNKEKLNESN